MRTSALLVLIPVLAACASSTPAAVSIEASPSASVAPMSSAAAATSAPAKPSASAVAASKPPSAEARVHLHEAQATGFAETTQAVAAMRPGLVQCFDAALKNDAELHGKLVVYVKIDPTGKVTGVKFDDELGLDVTLAGCLVNAVRTASFPPAPSGAALKVPLNVTP